MSVKLECYKCHQTFLVTLPVGFVPNADDTTVVGLCSHCSRLTYGPLTEEMVAEALWECIKKRSNLELKYQHPSLEEHTKRQARFVLRLLNEQFGRWTWSEKTARDWLLDLARQK